MILQKEVKNMHIEAIRTQTEWLSLAAEWNQLLAESITPVPFLRHEYLTAWWNHRGGGEWPDSTLYILVARDDGGELIGVAPLFSSKNHAGEDALMLIGSIEISDFLDIIVKAADLEPFLDALLSHLTGSNAPHWDSLEWANLLETTATLPALQTAAAKYGLTFHQERIQPAPVITLPGDFDAYLESLDSRYRRELIRKMRNALGYFIPVEWYDVEEENSLESEVNDFIAMMREEEDKDVFLTDKMVAQIHAIAQATFEAGYLKLSFLKVGKEKAAGYFNFDYNDRIWVYNSCIARKFGRLSPGIVLMGFIIQDAIEKGRAELDLMRGNEEYKYQLGGQDRYIIRATVKRAS
jgi:CelD/BcsL family acetyltransferase involved in cellulose biosynthesis